MTTLRQSWLRRCREAARFAGGMVALLIGIVGMLAGALLWAGIISP